MPDPCGWTLLHYATFYQHRPMALYLLSRGARVNARTRDYPTRCLSYSPISPGSTPLIIAAYFGFVDMVQVLLAGGAEARAVNADGYDAMTYAEKFEFEEVAGILDEYRQARAPAQVPYERPPSGRPF